MILDAVIGFLLQRLCPPQWQLVSMDGHMGDCRMGRIRESAKKEKGKVLETETVKADLVWQWSVCVCICTCALAQNNTTVSKVSSSFITFKNVFFFFFFFLSGK